MKRNRKFEYVDAQLVERARKLFKFKKGEFAELMGLKGTQYRNCIKKGGFLSHRFDSAMEAIENSALRKAFGAVNAIQKIKAEIGRISSHKDIDEESIDETDEN